MKAYLIYLVTNSATTGILLMHIHRHYPYSTSSYHHSSNEYALQPIIILILLFFFWQGESLDTSKPTLRSTTQQKISGLVSSPIFQREKCFQNYSHDNSPCLAEATNKLLQFVYLLKRKYTSSLISFSMRDITSMNRYFFLFRLHTSVPLIQYLDVLGWHLSISFSLIQQILRYYNLNLSSPFNLTDENRFVIQVAGHVYEA